MSSASSSSSSSSSSFPILSKDVLNWIVPYLHVGDLERFAGVDRLWSQVARDSLIMRRKVQLVEQGTETPVKQRPLIFEYEKNNVPLCYSKPWWKQYDKQQTGCDYPVTDLHGRFSNEFWEHKWHTLIDPNDGSFRLQVRDPENPQETIGGSGRWHSVQSIISSINSKGKTKFVLPRRFCINDNDGRIPNKNKRTDITHCSMVNDILVVIISHKTLPDDYEIDEEMEGEFDYDYEGISSPVLKTWYGLVYVLPHNTPIDDTNNANNNNNNNNKLIHATSVTPLTEALHYQEWLFLNGAIYGDAIRSPSGNRLAILHCRRLQQPEERQPPYGGDQEVTPSVTIYNVTSEGQLEAAGPVLNLSCFETGEDSPVDAGTLEMSFSVDGELLSVLTTVSYYEEGEWGIYDLTRKLNNNNNNNNNDGWRPHQILDVGCGGIYDIYYSLDNELIVHWETKEEMEHFLRRGDRPSQNPDIWEPQEPAQPPRQRRRRPRGQHPASNRRKLKPNLPFQDLPWMANRIVFLVGQPSYTDANDEKE